MLPHCRPDSKPAPPTLEWQAASPRPVVRPQARLGLPRIPPVSRILFDPSIAPGRFDPGRLGSRADAAAQFGQRLHTARRQNDFPDVLPVTVGTGPGLALDTRKGTGYYKVPSLKGVWYRGHYLHDGSVASLEEMFDPDRLKETHIPGGYSPPGVKARAIAGRAFGLKLSSREREQFIAFLRIL
jgi:hypothetical protein